MTIELTFDTTGINWHLAAQIFERAPLGTRQPEKLKTAFTNSDVVCFAWDGSVLVGMGRALSDGVYQSVIYDLCMLPEYQSRGLGSRMMQAIMELANTENVTLWSVPGKEPFYEQLGFRHMLTSMGKFKNPQGMVEKRYIR